MKTRLLGAVCVCLAAVTLNANAAIVDLGNITRDTATGLDWLDVTETRNLTYNQVAAQMGTGGTYEGWRYATMTDVDQLIINFGYTAVNTNCEYSSVHCDAGLSGDNQIIETMIKTLGDTGDAVLDYNGSSIDTGPDGAEELLGIFVTGNTSLPHTYVARIYDGEWVSRSTGEFWSDHSDIVDTLYTASIASLYAGSFLVQTNEFYVETSPVPVPAAVWLFGSGLLGLVGMARRKKA